MSKYTTDSIVAHWINVLLQRKRRLKELARVVQLNPSDPFHPLKSTMSGRDQSGGSAMRVRQWFASHAGRDEKPPRLGNGKAPRIARDRFDGHALRGRFDVRHIEQATEADAAPFLGRIPAASAVDGFNQDLGRGSREII